MRLPYLRAIENASGYTHEYRYAIIFQEKRPVAVAIFHLFELGGNNYGSSKKPATSKKHRILKRVKNQFNMRVLMCGNVYLEWRSWILLQIGNQTRKSIPCFKQTSFTAFAGPRKFAVMSIFN